METTPLLAADWLSMIFFFLGLNLADFFFRPTDRGSRDRGAALHTSLDFLHSKGEIIIWTYWVIFY